MPKRPQRIVTEKQWGIVDRHRQLIPLGRGWSKGSAQNEAQAWDVQNGEDAPHHLVRVTLSFPLPRGTQ